MNGANLVFEVALFPYTGVFHCRTRASRIFAQKGNFLFVHVFGISNVSCGFSGEEKVSIAQDVACDGRDLKLEQMALYCSTCSPKI